jgi:hypothetical protein
LTLTWVTSNALAAVCLKGCPVAGAISIGEKQAYYNEVGRRTSMKQMFDNILRVYQDLPTLFMDVTEVDASLLLSAGLSGTISSIGTLAGKTKARAGSLDNKEQSDIRR